MKYEASAYTDQVKPRDDAFIRRQERIAAK